MKRLKRVALLLITLTMLMSAVVANAAISQDTLSKVQAKLGEAGVQANAITGIIDYLSVKGLSAADANALCGKVDSLVAKYGNKELNRDNFTRNELLALYEDGKSTAQAFGMNMNLDADNELIEVISYSGSSLGVYTPAQLKKIALGINTDKLKEALMLIVENQITGVEDEAVPDVNGGKVTTDSNGNQVTLFDAAVKNPIMATEMKKTASNNGNLLLAGVALLALGGTVYAVSRKKVMA